MPRTRRQLPHSSLNRRAFLGTGLAALPTAALGCRRGVLLEGDRVVVIGAGPAGLTTAYQLLQAGVDVTVLEANTTHGGRIRHDLSFADFPISLGAEWLHVSADVLDDIVNDPTVAIETRLEDYERDDPYGYYDGRLELTNLGPVSDLKFIGSSWLGFFDDYVVPTVAPHISFESQVVEVDWQDVPLRLTGAHGETWEAERVVVTVPLALLQRGEVTFSPELPNARTNAIASATVWAGFKMFLAFSEAFYPTFLEFPNSDTEAGQRLYYDAAYGQATDMNVLGLFAVGVQAESYQRRDDADRLDYVLNELDGIFGGAASRTYQRHLAQNWNDEPFARGAYLNDEARLRTSRVLAGSLDRRLFFAGDAYTQFADWGSVHAACRSAIDVVGELIG